MLKTRTRGGQGRAVYSRAAGGPTLWTTALGSNRAYATLLRGAQEKIISVRR